MKEVITSNISITTFLAQNNAQMKEDKTQRSSQLTRFYCESFSVQCNRLQAAGYRSVMATSLSELLLQKRKGKLQKSNSVMHKRLEVVPYCHRAAHNLKNVANGYQVLIVFSAPLKLSTPWSRTSKANKKRECDKTNFNFVDSSVSVVARFHSHV